MEAELPDSSDIVATLERLNPNALMYEGFDGALVGMIARCGTEPLALYDREKCIQILVDKGASEQEAEEYFQYNVEGCWAGPNTPFIASFNLKPLGMGFTVDGESPLESREDAAEVFIGTYVHGRISGEE